MLLAPEGFASFPRFTGVAHFPMLLSSARIFAAPPARRSAEPASNAPQCPAH
jgi:hypothetical protein